MPNEKGFFCAGLLSFHFQSKRSAVSFGSVVSFLCEGSGYYPIFQRLYWTYVEAVVRSRRSVSFATFRIFLNRQRDIRGQISRPASGRVGENDPPRVVFENLSNLTKVRVSADSHGLGDQGLGTGLVVRGAAVVKLTKTVY